MVLSAEPVATTVSAAGLNARVLIASRCWPSVDAAERVVSLSRVSMICRVMSSDTVPIRDS